MPDGLTDALVPAIDGYYYVGNGVNDATDYLIDVASDGESLTIGGQTYELGDLWA